MHVHKKSGSSKVGMYAIRTKTAQLALLKVSIERQALPVKVNVHASHAEDRYQSDLGSSIDSKVPNQTDWNQAVGDVTNGANRTVEISEINVSTSRDARPLRSRLM